MFSTGFSSGDRDGRKRMVRFFATFSFSVTCQPALSMRMTACPGGNGLADLVEMHLYGFGVGPGQHERRALAPHGTYRAE
jgi:hypothetical protein